MSDLLSRLAARATATGTVTARPLLPSRFEAADATSLSGDVSEADRVGHVAPAHTPAPATSRAPEGVPIVDGERDATQQETRHADSVGASSSAVSARDQPATTRATLPPAGTPKPLADPLHDSTQAEAPVSAATRPPVVAAVALPAPEQPAAQHVSMGERHPHIDPAGRGDAPVVHVSIGRLDIRATAPEPVREAAQPADRPDAAKVTLGDYLRGAREPR